MLRIRNLLNLAQHSSRINCAFPEISPCALTLLNGSFISQLIGIQTTFIPYRFSSFSTNNNNDKSSSANQTQSIGDYHTLTEYNAYNMIANLSDNERASLSKALSKYNSDKIKSKFQGKFLNAYSKLAICYTKMLI